jgi:hypothetical protein
MTVFEPWPFPGAQGAQRPERKEMGTGRASPADGYGNHAKMRVSPAPPTRLPFAPACEPRQPTRTASATGTILIKTSAALA